MDNAKCSSHGPDSVYEYIIVASERTSEDERKNVLVKGPTAVLARSEEAVRMIAAREVPEPYASDMNHVWISVRPFLAQR